MMRLAAVGLVVLFATLSALAGPPDTSGLNDKQARALLMRLGFATVAVINCADWLASSAEWKLITDTSDQLASQLGLTVETYDVGFYAPAFDAIASDPRFCDIEGPRITTLLEDLLAAGGSLDKIKISQ